MYNPKHFKNGSANQVHEFIKLHPFATVLSYPENSAPHINHLPVLFKSEDPEEKILIGHMAKMNPQWHHFKHQPHATVIIHGPHTYITPTWYKSGCDVPTWNYAVAHLNGKMKIIEGYDEQITILKLLSAHFEKSTPHPWEFELPEDLRDPQTLTSAIVSFEFQIEHIDAKFKLSQNRSDADKQGVIEGLSSRQDDMSQKIRDMMMASRL